MRGVRLSVMPKGVEHRIGQASSRVSLRVRLSVMPKGVEHGELAGGPLPVAACDFQ